MLSVLLEIPRTQEQWERWNFHHRTSHDDIRQGIEAQGGANLPDYVIDPINFERFADFLQANSQLHIDMTAALGIQSENLQDVDIRKENELVAWIAIHYQDHFSSESALGI